MKKTRSILASLLLAFAIFSQLVVPVNAATPTYDITGVWNDNVGGTFQIFQEKDEINVVYVNSGFAHRFSGRYVTPTKIEFILIRRTRPNTCEMTMEGTIDVNSANSIKIVSKPLENACGISIGQSYPGTATRVL